MTMKRVALLIVSGMACASYAQQPRIALLQGTDARHHDEFDLALSQLGWTADRYVSNTNDMKVLSGKLSDYDLLLACPLFNFGNSPVLPGPDRQAYLKFLNDGGMIAITDGTYPAVRAWVADLDPAFTGLEEGKCTSSQWAVLGATVDAQPMHPLRFFPSKITEPDSWGHLQKFPADSPWRVVANCSEGFPVAVVQKVGKGVIYLSALRQPTVKHLGNLYACLLLNRAGVEIKSFNLPEPRTGSGMITLSWDEGHVPEKCTFVYEIVAADGKRERFEGQVGGTVFELPYRITLRGPATTRFSFKRENQETLLFSQSIVLPPLLEIKPSVYRGILSTARRLPAVNFDFTLSPDQEVLEKGTIDLNVFNASGNCVAATNMVLSTNDVKFVYQQPVLLDKSLAAGEYVVKATLKDFHGTKLADAETSIKILSPTPAQTIIDQDNTFLVNGQPFFPMGLYHVPPSDYPTVAGLGINTVQFWVWDFDVDSLGVSRGLAKASAVGLKTIIELNHKNETIIQDIVKQHGANPAILMWYGLDEPAEGSYSTADMMRRTFHAVDNEHPIFQASCRPDIFAEQSVFTDVFGLDPYGSPQKVLDWMTNAVTAMAGRKPVVCVPGAFCEDTLAAFRASAYIALASDARGIVWYPWNQMGGGPIGIGLKNHPEHQGVVSQICAEVSAMLPALTAPDRRTLASADGSLRGLFCVKDAQRFLLLVNSTPSPIQVEAAIPQGEEFTQKMRDFFKKDNLEALEIKAGRFGITLEPYETRVYEGQ